jgi:hypothetical protein
VEAALNAFDIAFDGRVFAGRRQQPDNHLSSQEPLHR